MVEDMIVSKFPIEQGAPEPPGSDPSMAAAAETVMAEDAAAETPPSTSMARRLAGGGATSVHIARLDELGPEQGRGFLACLQGHPHRRSSGVNIGVGGGGRRGARVLMGGGIRQSVRQGGRVEKVGGVGGLGVSPHFA